MQTRQRLLCNVGDKLWCGWWDNWRDMSEAVEGSKDTLANQWMFSFSVRLLFSYWFVLVTLVSVSALDNRMGIKNNNNNNVWSLQRMTPGRDRNGRREEQTEIERESDFLSHSCNLIVSLSLFCTANSSGWEWCREWTRPDQTRHMEREEQRRGILVVWKFFCC